MSESAILTKPVDTNLNAPAQTNLLNASHRCDKCSAAAFVKVNLLPSDALPDGGTLMFCSHHYNKVEVALIPFMDGAPVDERWKLTWDRHMGTENS